MYNNMRSVVLTFESQGAFQTQEHFKWKNKQSLEQRALAGTRVKSHRSSMAKDTYIDSAINSRPTRK